MRFVGFLVASCAAVSIAGAQTSSADAVFARAKQLVVSGNGAAGRVLVDSVLAASTPDSPVYADALYWRAALAASPDDAERDYRRIIVEYPLSPKAGESMYQLAELEAARGDRAGAVDHLQHFVLENPKAEQRPRAYMQLVRLLFEQNDYPHGCSALHDALAAIPKSDVERRNQLDYYSPRCAANDVGPGGRVPISQPTLSPPPKDTARRADSARTVSAKYTLQVAAYTSRTEADALAKRLKARKLDARVVKGGKLYRVRIGRFPTRVAAVAEQKTLKGKRISTMVAEMGPDDK
jgi:tetratricopeptide (TPR) repeat protein